MKNQSEDSLTTKEIELIERLGEWFKDFKDNVVGYNDTRDADINEAIHKIHDLQRMIMKQAAARAYPHKFRLLGEIINDDYYKPANQMTEKDWIG